jgi:hypothetical protein
VKRVGRLITAATLAVSVTVGATALVASPAAAAPAWCGNWLSDPGRAGSVSAVPGTGGAAGGSSSYMRVNQGTYGGKWYAWAKIFNAGGNGRLALIWVNRSDSVIYQCGWGSSAYATNDHGGYSGVTGSWYTAGVDAAHAKKVQAKGTYDVYLDPNDWYGPAVFWAP